MSPGCDGPVVTDDIPTDRPILLFDGACNLCHSLVQFVLARDPDAEFRFAALQSDAGRALLERFDLPTDDFDTFVLVEGDDHYLRSTAALLVLRRLGLPWSLCYPAIAVPRSLRDRAYGFLAARRYDWFGTRETCLVPSADVERRFLE